MNFRDFLHRKKVTGRTFYRSGSFCVGDEPKSGLVRDLGDRLQSRNVTFGTSGDCVSSRYIHRCGSAGIYYPYNVNPGVNQPMNEKLPYYMAYPTPFSYDDERTERMDLEYLRSMYPDIPKRLLPYVEEECDRMEYENSMVYDQYPDKLQLRMMCRRAYDNALRHERDLFSRFSGSDTPSGRDMEDGEMDAGETESQARRNRNPGREDGRFLRDLIEVMLYQEVYKRRCDHRRKCRRFY